METTKVTLNADNRGEVEIYADGKKAGLMEIDVKNNVLTVYHTEVDPAYEGKGFARVLLNQLVSYAREQHIKIVPLCPYVLMQFKRRPDDYKDVWAKAGE